ncbi:hypothetical protein OG496_18400 [Streptomyces sp. NBC_00988]|uniref:hypothetical protein n=1 Tax=Streptomyces sp. NBC_00988 TaxID=2903704 RepID=UPI00386AACFC|nr:hypothetical protein OG496_18400 [Streptomyces sp. NBC_00988]
MLQHAIPPARFFSQTPNEIIRHPRLNGTAVRLLQWALSLPEGSRETVQSIGEKMPEGRLAVRKARRQLEEEGYLHTRRSQHPETGQWSTQVLVSNVALRTPEEIATAFGPSDQDPPVGAGADQAVGAYPLGGNTEENTPNQPVPPSELERGAANFLARLGDRTPALRLGAGEIERLTPLVARWQARGATEADLYQALTADLPHPVRSPAALVSYRLEARTPAIAAPRKPVETLAECGECRDPLPRGVRTGICRRCAGLGPVPSAPAPTPVSLNGIALVRAALSGVCHEAIGRSDRWASSVKNAR